MNTRFRLAWFVLLMVAAIAYPTTVRSQSIILENYDQSSVPKNKGGDTYPSSYVGISNIGIGTTDRAPQTSGNSLKFDFGGQLQFNPYTGSSREYTHTYANCGYPVVCGTSPWQTNTYTKFQYWVKVPTNSPSVDYGAGTIATLASMLSHIQMAIPTLMNSQAVVTFIIVCRLEAYRDLVAGHSKHAPGS